MSLRYLLDTNVISEPLRPQPDPNTLTRLHRHQSEVAIAAVVWHELWYGCGRLPSSVRRDRITHYLTQCGRCDDPGAALRRNGCPLAR